MITIENSTFSMQIALLGAEPQSLISKKSKIEYLWNGNKEYWPRRAPLLFPVTGSTKNNQIEAKGKVYTMPVNGFARDLPFTLVSKSSDTATFILKESAQSKEFYPYDFSLTVTYSLHEEGYTAEATVLAQEDLYFTFGWHPAFNLDMNGENTPLETYTVTFDQTETVDRKYPSDGVFVTEKEFLKNQNTLRMSREETDKGPIILNNLASSTLTLTSSKGSHGVKVERGNLQTMVLWTPPQKRAQFLCIEPMHSFGDIEREFALEKMQESLLLKAGNQQSFRNTFSFF